MRAHRQQGEGRYLQFGYPDGCRHLFPAAEKELRDGIRGLLSAGGQRQLCLQR